MDRLLEDVLMQSFILERSSAGVFGYCIQNSDISTQEFFVETKRGVLQRGKDRAKLHKKFKQLAGLYETKAGVRRIGDELNRDQ